MSPRIKMIAIILVALAGGAMLIWKGRSSSSSSSFSTANSQEHETPATGASKIQKREPIPAPDAQKPHENEARKVSQESSSDLKYEGHADKPFEDWLMRFGYELTSADIISMLKSNMPAQRKRRLLDFFVSESDEGYLFFSSQNGMDFLEQLLSNNNNDTAFAQRVGGILRWFARGKANELSDQYETKFAKSSSEAEKAGLISAITDGKFLKTVAYDHTQPLLVRQIAVENLLLDDKDAKTLRGLLNISDTQQKYSDAVVSAAVHAANNADELQNVMEVLKGEGMLTPQNAKVVGEALATSRRSFWARSLDTSGDEFLTKALQHYRLGLENGLKPPSFP